MPRPRRRSCCAQVADAAAPRAAVAGARAAARAGAGRSRARGPGRGRLQLLASCRSRRPAARAAAAPAARRCDAPRLLPESGELTALACGVCTLGPTLERASARCSREKRASLALALDELGNELLFAVSRRAQDRMLADASPRGLSMAGELDAGDPGLALDAQAAVLRLAEAEHDRRRACNRGHAAARRSSRPPWCSASASTCRRRAGRAATTVRRAPSAAGRPRGRGDG